LIELLKGNKNALSINTVLIKSRGTLFFYNHIVLSETIYQLYFKRGFDLITIETILNEFDLLEPHNLKPNDALILATCKHHEINCLISLDEDFKQPCEKEEITLINSAKKLEKVLK
jgi:predicted nucleic acid-binding protein